MYLTEYYVVKKLLEINCVGIAVSKKRDKIFKWLRVFLSALLLCLHNLSREAAKKCIETMRRLPKYRVVKCTSLQLLGQNTSYLSIKSMKMHWKLLFFWKILWLMIFYAFLEKKKKTEGFIFRFKINWLNFENMFSSLLSDYER